MICFNHYLRLSNCGVIPYGLQTVDVNKSFNTTPQYEVAVLRLATSPHNDILAY